MVSGAGDGQFVTLVDQQGKVRKSINTKFSTTYSSRITKAEADANGNIYMMQWTTRSLPLQPYYSYYTSFAKIDTALNKYWGMVYATSNGYFADAALSKKKSFAAVGTDIGYVTDGVLKSRDFRFIKIDTPVVSSDLNCNYNTLDYVLASPAINRIDFNWVNDSSLDLTPVPVNILVKDAYMQSRYSCPDFIDSCSFMKITGPVAMCSYTDSYTYRLHRNRKCTLLPQWNLSLGVTLMNQTDSTLTVKFAAFGIYSIGAVLKSCIPVADSLIINVKPKTSSLNIGNDTILCANTFITLHAGPAFMNYIWKDGSTDSVLKASQPGIYWVQVMDSCGNSLRDSLIINPFNLAISIGPDRTKCNMDTLHLNGPDGFVSYEWGGNYNLSSTNSKSVIVNPLVDTSYYLKAEKMPGCFAYDTVNISVKISPAIQLGQDISFCNGDSSILNAGTGFAKYQWGGGSTTQVITIYSKGDYSIIGTTAAGCKSFDTLRVLNVWANPMLNLDHNPNLCIGSTRTLQPGNYSSYIWQDGSILPSFTISAPGNYSVTVTDNHQCKGSDTVHILTLLPLPANFLPADTALCSYDEIAVKSSQVFSSYLWSTGETGASVTIKQAGTYWLLATDQYACTGKDSVTVLPKECMKGLYVPTAFSPNQDGKNDVFKALIFGNVLHFEWTIYNRYGRVVFTTHNTAEGWDGTVKGIPQDPAGFMWQCRYQLEGEKMKFKSGAVVLVR